MWSVKLWKVLVLSALLGITTWNRQAFSTPGAQGSLKNVRVSCMRGAYPWPQLGHVCCASQSCRRVFSLRVACLLAMFYEVVFQCVAWGWCLVLSLGLLYSRVQQQQPFDLQCQPRVAWNPAYSYLQIWCICGEHNSLKNNIDHIVSRKLSGCQRV